MQPMGGGLDQQINEKVDAYRNNPQALQQRYQQNQQLIDLLALQKLKSEKREIRERFISSGKGFNRLYERSPASICATRIRR